jgi:hypothetical protein
MISIDRYHPDNKQTWDNFIQKSKNGLFLFLRDYMDYHSDRFQDFSLMFQIDRKVIAMMPANIDGDSLYSHEGLTFGGMITDKKLKTKAMLKIFDAMKEYLKEQGINNLYYKAIPHIYPDLPSEEDLYALYYNNAELVRRDVSSTVYLNGKLNISRGQKRNSKNCEKAGIEVKRSYDFKQYMDFKKKSLNEKYGLNPVHTGDEMQLLADKFPENIKLFNAQKDDEFYAGTIIYESNNVAHGQYLTASDSGLKIGASSMLIHNLINKYASDKKYFDLGISTEDNGRYLNEGLIDLKERFGARAIVHDFYKLNI